MAEDTTTAPTIAEVGSPGAANADIMVSGDYTILGIFLVWGGILAIAWLLVRRVNQGAFRFAADDEKKFMKVPPFKRLDRVLGFVGTLGFFSGFGFILLDLLR